jgi:hypothetical protein
MEGDRPQAVVRGGGVSYPNYEVDRLSQENELQKLRIGSLEAVNRALERENDRIRHGVEIESDFICPNEVEAQHAEDATTEAIAAYIDKVAESKSAWVAYTLMQLAKHVRAKAYR